MMNDVFNILMAIMFLVRELGHMNTIRRSQIELAQDMTTPILGQSLSTGRWLTNGVHEGNVGKNCASSGQTAISMWLDDLPF